MDYDLIQEFEKFAGKELQKPDPNDPVLQEIEALAKSKPIELRVIWGEVPTSDLRDDRLNVILEESNNKWRVRYFDIF